MLMQYNVVAKNPESTVVAEYIPYKPRELAYQAEAELEHSFIELLQTQAYEYLTFTTEEVLITQANIERVFDVSLR
jgi:type I restriction enzyme, R subunit